jgi:hypothetical protein
MLTDRVEGSLRAALETMRSFIDQAETTIDRDKAKPERDPNEIIGYVQAKLAWGIANASSDIRDALSIVASDRERGNATS